MGWSADPASTSIATFSGWVTHANGQKVRVQVDDQVSPGGPVNTVDGKEAMEAAINAILTDTDFTLDSASLLYRGDGENYTP